MKWIWILILTAMVASPVHSKERLGFPFDQTTRITFIRLGDISADAGQQFVLKVENGQWTIERRISRYHATFEDISEERAHEILAAFSDLYKHWQKSPYRDRKKPTYSLYISINETWNTALRVKDRGSPELNHLIKLIEYPDGVVLNEVKKSKAPGVIRASSEGDKEESEEDGQSPPETGSGEQP